MTAIAVSRSSKTKQQHTLMPSQLLAIAIALEQSPTGHDFIC